jgi:Ser/Thr protein kinase RdoA (MazF antagonist)
MFPVMPGKEEGRFGGAAMYSSSELDAIASLFGLAILECRELPYGSRWMGRRYAITTAAGKFFLKVRSEWWPIDQAKYVCALAQYLQAQKFPIASFRLTTQGEPFALWEGHICECHEFVEGPPLMRDSLDQSHGAGQTLSLYHSLTQGYSARSGHLPEGCGYPWPRHVAFFADRLRSLFAGKVEAMVTLERVLDALTAIDAGGTSPSCQVRIVVHGDYHPANLILQKDHVVAVCDFDFVQQAPRAYDAGYFLYRTAGRESRGGGGAVRIDRDIAQAFLAGYWSGFPASSPPVSRGEIGRELLRFAWYDCLLEANNTQDHEKLEEWSSDIMSLSDDVGQWAR